MFSERPYFLNFSVELVRSVGQKPHNGGMKLPKLSLWIAIVLISTGCASPRYGLKPNAQGSQSLYQNGDTGILHSQGETAEVWLSAVVLPVMDTPYILVAAIATNKTTTDINFTTRAFEIVTSNSRGSIVQSPLEPEPFLSKLAKERQSRDTSREWGAFLGALIASHQGGTYSGMAADGTVYTGTYSSDDYGQMAQSLKTGAQANQEQSMSESDMIRLLDMYLLRSTTIKPGGVFAGVVLFPFLVHDSYIVRFTINGEQHDFSWQLRQY
jgi:hypothetical protein